MGRAGKALYQVLLEYDIPQNQLAIMMDVDRSNISRWVNETRDPSAESVAELKDALADIQVEAGDDFVRYFLYEKPLTLVPIKPLVPIQPKEEFEADAERIFFNDCENIDEAGQDAEEAFDENQTLETEEA